MHHYSPSALVTGQRVLLRLDGRIHELTQDELRTVLGLPAGPSGVGISIDGDQFSFEFAADDKFVELSTQQLKRRLAKQPTLKR